MVVSTFNRASLLRGAVERLVTQQTTVPYELIVIDNNSTDDTPRVLEELERQYPDRFRRGFEPRQGVSYGRNAGIELSRAQVLAFTDDDVRVTPGWVDLIATTMETHPHIDCVGGRVLPIWNHPPPSWVTTRHWSPLALVDYGDQPFQVDHARPLCLVTANAAYRRAALDEIGWFSPDFPRCQDHELLLRLWDAGRSGLYLPSLVVTCEVPQARLTWSYHQQWHATHGRLCAQMRDGRAGPHGNAADEYALTLFGSPAGVYRHLVSSAKDYVLGRILRKDARARDAEVAIRHRAAFIRARLKRWRQGERSALGEIAQFISGWFQKRRWQTTHRAAPRA